MPIAQEVCDGFDNDLDGKVDEAHQDCPTCKSTGACSDAVEAVCRDGAWACEYRAPRHELSELTCDGLDNDCNGKIDDAPNCGEEICDGIDNDWDGATDNVSSGPCVRLCSPQALHCHEGSIHQCDASGFTHTLLEECGPAAAYCGEVGGTPKCLDLLCNPNHGACDGDNAAICTEDGLSYRLDGTNCAASAQLCVEGSCATQAVDVVSWGGTPSPLRDATANLVRATKDRTLTQIDLDVEWRFGDAEGSVFVFEATGRLGPYKKLLNSSIGMSYLRDHRYFDPVTVAGLSVPIKAGNYYLIGVSSLASRDHEAPDRSYRPLEHRTA